MWRRLRRTTMAPRRPAVHMRQVPLAVASIVALLAGIGLLVWLVWFAG